MLGRVAAGGAARWAGDRLDSRGTEEERQRRRGDRVVATIDSLVDQLAVMRGRGDEGRPGALDGRVPRPRPRPVRVPAAAARVASRQRPRGLLEADARGARARSGARRPRACSPRSTPSRPRRRASARSTARADPRGREVAVKVQYPGIAEAVESDMRNLRHAHPGPAPADAGARDQGRARRAARADRRGVRLRARGGQPPPRRPLLARPPVRRASRRSTPSSAAGGCWSPSGSTGSGSSEVARAARPGPRPLRRDRLPLLLRQRAPSSASRSATRTRATTCCATTAGSPSSTSGWCATCRASTCAARARSFAAMRDVRRARRCSQAMRELGYLPGTLGRVGRRAAPRRHARGGLVVAGDEPLPARARGPVAR